MNSKEYITPADGLECDGCQCELQVVGYEYNQEDGMYICYLCGGRTPDDIVSDGSSL